MLLLMINCYYPKSDLMATLQGRNFSCQKSVIKREKLLSTQKKVIFINLGRKWRQQSGLWLW
jgi:hypothetical protein